MRIAALIVLAALLVVGCSQLSRFRLHNDTGGEVIVQLKKDSAGSKDLGDVRIAIARGKARTFQGSQIRGERLRVTSGACSYVYALSEDELYDLDIRGWRFPVDLRLRPDFVLELDHPRRPPADPEEVGFPRKPLSRSCG